MKKLILVLVSVLFAFITYAQDIDVSSLKSSTDAYINVQGTKEVSYVWDYPEEVTDTLGASDSWTYTIAINKDFSSDLKYEARCELDSVLGSPGVSFILQGKYSWNDSWTSLDTVVWAGTDGDTTMAITYATAKNYRFARIYLVSDATAQRSQVERVEFGVYD